ncbi:hypothetical protein ACIPUC_00620 [Streptomyces sp. LARHCF249]
MHGAPCAPHFQETGAMRRLPAAQAEDFYELVSERQGRSVP